MIRRFVGVGFLLSVGLMLSVSGVAAHVLDSNGEMFPKFIADPEPILNTVIAREIGTAPPVTQTSNIYTQCSVLAPGTEFWFPGWTAPHPLYADTVARKLVYTNPENSNMVILYRSWKNSDGSTSSATEFRPITHWCY